MNFVSKTNIFDFWGTFVGKRKQTILKERWFDIPTCGLFAVPELLEAGPADGLHALHAVEDAGEVQAPLLRVVHCDDHDLYT